jgi:hypothetical protein
MDFYEPWWLFFATHSIILFVVADEGASVVVLERPKWTVVRFEFYPSNQNNHMIPLWAAYPFYSSVTINWRMGSGESYKYSWHAWYRKLSPEKREEYQTQFPPPVDERRSWNDFYAEIADVPGDPSSLSDLIIGRVPE